MKKVLVVIALMIFSSQLFAQVERKAIQDKGISYKNPDNPYDDAGQKHNDGVSFIMRKLKNKQNVTKEDIVVATVEYLKEEPVKEIGAKIMSDNSFPTVTKKTYPSVSQSILSEVNATFENSENLQSFINAIKSIEAKVLVSKSIKEDDKVALLKSLAVGRYSAFFWNNYDNGGNPAGKIKWSTIKNDLEGAGTGAGIGGAIGGPGGAVIGGIAGAIIGSCCAAYDIQKGDNKN